jgi:hypothetical protein
MTLRYWRGSLSLKMPNNVLFTTFRDSFPYYESAARASA